MSDPKPQVEITQEAREASMSRVVTQDQVLANLVAAEPAPEAPSEVLEDKQEPETKPKVKQSAQERIIELAKKRKEAEKAANETKRENEDLRARIAALEANAPTIKQLDKPKRDHFVNEEDFIEAIADWKIAERETQQQQARLAIEFQDIEERFTQTVEAAKDRYSDYADVVGKSKIKVPDFLIMALKESPIGGDLAYYLAKHPDEAAKVIGLRPVQALKYLNRLEDDILAPEDSQSEKLSEVASVKPAEKRRAPEPISPVKGLAVTPGTARSFEEYRAQRKAQRR